MSAHSVTHRCTTLVLGSGVAGLTYALRTAEHGPVLILTKKFRSDSSTNRAQGGLAAVLGPTDSFEPKSTWLATASVSTHFDEENLNTSLC